MTRLLAIIVAVACAAALVMSIDPAFLQWLLVRAWVLALAVAPGAALVATCFGLGIGSNGLCTRLRISPLDGRCAALPVFEWVILSFACGMGVLSCFVFLMGLIDVGSAARLAVLIGLMHAFWAARTALRGRSRPGATENPQAHTARGESCDVSKQSTEMAGFGSVACFGSAIAWIVFAVAAGLVALTALTPSLIFDVTEYHLGAWTSYLQRNGEPRFTPMPYNIYARFPFPIEAIYFAGLGLTPGIDTAPKLINAVCVLACAGLAWCFARRLGGGRTASAVAALLALTHPVMLNVSIDALIDAPVALLVAGSFYAGFTALGVFEVRDSPDQFDSPTQPAKAAPYSPVPQFTFITIFLFGVAIAAKYTVAQLYLLPWTAVVFAPLVWQEIRNKPGRRALLIGCLAAAVPCLIWFGKNIAWYGNPLEPFFVRIFRPGDTAAIAREKFYIESHFPQSPLSADYWKTLLPRLHEFGWVLLVACAGWILAYERRRALLRFAAVAMIAFLLWNTVRASEDRFLLPLFVMLAAFAAVGAEAIPMKPARRAMLTVLVLFAAANTIKHGLRVHESKVLDYILNFAPSSRTTDFSASPEPTPREEFLKANLGDLGEVINHVNRALPAEARLLLIYEARPYLFRADTEYNVVWDDSWLLDAIRPAKNADEAIEWLRHQGITHVLVNRQELLRYIQQYARRNQLLRLGVGYSEDPRAAWLATSHPEDLYPPFYRDKDWERLRPIVHELLDRFDMQATYRRGAPSLDATSPGPPRTVQPKPLDVIVAPVSAL